MKKLLALAILALSACESAPVAYQPQPFAYGPAIRVNVAQVRVVDNSAQLTALPHVERDFPTPLNTAVSQWANQRLVASPTAPVGSIMEVSIDDASAIAVPLPKKTGIEGMFTDEQDTRYDARVKITMRLYSGGKAMSDAEGDVIVSRSHTINEKATVAERQKLLDQIAHDLLSSLNQQAELRLRQYFSPYLR